MCSDSGYLYTYREKIGSLGLEFVDSRCDAKQRQFLLQRGKDTGSRTSTEYLYSYHPCGTAKISDQRNLERQKEMPLQNIPHNTFTLARGKQPYVQYGQWQQ